MPDHEDVHRAIENRQLLEQHAPEVQSADITFAIAAERLLDGFNLGFVTDRFPDERLDPVEAVEHDRIEFVLLGLQRPELVEEFADCFSLREPGDVELLGAFLGADKDRVGCMRAKGRLADAVRTVDEREDMAGPFAA